MSQILNINLAFIYHSMYVFKNGHYIFVALHLPSVTKWFYDPNFKLMTSFHCINVRMQSISKVVDLKVNWDENLFIRNVISKVNTTTFNTLFSVVVAQSKLDNNI